MASQLIHEPHTHMPAHTHNHANIVISNYKSILLLSRLQWYTGVCTFHHLKTKSPNRTLAWDLM